MWEEIWRVTFFIFDRSKNDVAKYVKQIDTFKHTSIPSRKFVVRNFTIDLGLTALF